MLRVPPLTGVPVALVFSTKEGPPAGAVVVPALVVPALVPALVVPVVAAAPPAPALVLAAAWVGADDLELQADVTSRPATAAAVSILVRDADMRHPCVRVVGA